MRRLASMLLAFGVTAAMAQPSPFVRPRVAGQEQAQEKVMQQIDYFNALERGDMAAVKSWLSRGMSVNEVQSYGFEQGRTPLIAAAAHGNTKLVRFLLQRGADVNQRNTLRGDFALLEAVKRTDQSSFAEVDYLATVKLLLQAGADANQGDGSGVLPLYFAGSTAAMVQLLKAGARPNAPTSWPPLIQHAAHAERVALLLKAGANPDVRDAFGDTVLYKAAREGSLEAVQLLLSVMSAEAIQTPNNDGITALADAVVWPDNVPVISALIGKGLQPTKAIWLRALARGHLQAAQLIWAANPGEEWKVSLEGSDHHAQKDVLSVYAAIAQGRPDLARRFYQQFEANSCGKGSLLMQEVSSENGEAVRALLALNIDVNYQDPAPLRSESFIPALSSSGFPVMRYALPSPCNTESMGAVRWRGTALSIAVENNDLGMAQLLVQAGADPLLSSLYPPHGSPQSLWQELQGKRSKGDDVEAWRKLLGVRP